MEVMFSKGTEISIIDQGTHINVTETIKINGQATYRIFGKNGS